MDTIDSTTDWVVDSGRLCLSGSLRSYRCGSLGLQINYFEKVFNGLHCLLWDGSFKKPSEAIPGLKWSGLTGNLLTFCR
jgi:hypothetical protein